MILAVAVPFLSSCAATIDFFSYSYTPPGPNDPQATLSFAHDGREGGVYLRHVDANNCDMGGTPLFSRTKKTETIHAEKPVFILHSFSPLRSRTDCATQLAFTPKAGGTYEISGKMIGDSCFSTIYEVKGSQRVRVQTKLIVYTKSGITACRKMYAGEAPKETD